MMLHGHSCLCHFGEFETLCSSQIQGYLNGVLHLYTSIITYSSSQMMFVSGETAEASAECTTLIEQIVLAQVVEMVRLSSRLTI